MVTFHDKNGNEFNQTMVYAAHTSNQGDPQLAKEGENADIHISSQNVPTFQRLYGEIKGEIAYLSKSFNKIDLTCGP